MSIIGLIALSLLSKARVCLMRFWVLLLILPVITCYANTGDVDISPEEQNDIELVDDAPQEIIKRSERAQAYYEQIGDVLKGEEFGKTEFVKAWRLIKDEEAQEEKFPEWLIKLFEWLEKNQKDKSDDKSYSFNLFDIALGLEVLLWILVIGLLVLVMVKYREQIGSIVGLLKPSQKAESLPTTMFGLDIQNETLPDDILGTARENWQSGEPRLALATLLRASLVRLFTDHQCRFYDSDTEAECCQRIDKQAPSILSGYMRLLVSAWQQIAYAHRVPSNDDFEVLCVKWQEAFQ